MARGELAELLEAWGAEDVPPPRAGFLDDLEARFGAVEPEPAVEARRPARAVLAVAAVLVLLVGAVALGRGAGDPGPARVDVADDGAPSLPGPAGAGGLDEPPVTVTTARRPAGGRAAAGGAPGSQGADSSGGPGGSDARPGEAGGPAAEEPVPAEGAAPPAADGEVARFELRGWGSAARVFLEWDRYQGEDFAAYLVLRAISPDSPSYGHERTMTELRIEDRDRTAHQTTPKVGSATNRYQVVVVDRRGRVVAASNVVEPQSNPDPNTGRRLL